MESTKLQTGDVIFVYMPFVWYKPVRYISWCIRKVLGTWYNHVALYVEIWEADHIAESSAGGVQNRPLSKWARDYEVEVKRPTTPYLKKTLAKRLMRYQGYTGYDYISLLFFQLVYQITKIWIGKTKGKALKKLYCSEYAALVYEEIFPEWWLTTPRDIYTSSEFETVIKRTKATNLI